MENALRPFDTAQDKLRSLRLRSGQAGQAENDLRKRRALLMWRDYRMVKIDQRKEVSGVSCYPVQEAARAT